jgi:hypothetical protein
MTSRGEAVPMEEVAADWYDRVYAPTVETIHREGLNDHWPDATDADLFLWVGQRRRELFPELTEGLDIEGSVRAAHDVAPRAPRRPRGGQ